MVRQRGFCVDKEKYKVRYLLEFVDGRRRRLKLSQAKLGGLIGITQQAFGSRMDENRGNGNFSYIELVKLFKELRVTDEEILKLMKME